MFTESTDDRIVTLRLAHGKANALDVELASALVQRLELLQHESVHGVVVTGAHGIFSAGVDLFRVIDGGHHYVERFLASLDRLFSTLFLFPAPVVAAVNGHAIAGGCILASACDRRIMVEGPGRIGLPELRVGVPFPRLAIEIMRSAVPPPHLQELLYLGKTYDAAGALEIGLVDETASEHGLLSRARAAAHAMASVPPTSFALTKRGLRREYVEQAMTDSNRATLLEAWTSAEAMTAIRTYVQKTLRRG